MRFRLGSNGQTSPGARRLRCPGGLARSRGWVAAAGAAVAIVATLVGVVVAGVFPGPGAGAAASSLPPWPLRPGLGGRPGHARRGRPAAPARAELARLRARQPAGLPRAAGPGRGPPLGAAHLLPVGGAHRRLHLGRTWSRPATCPDPAQRLAAQYADVGVRHAWIDASGGRSMVEVLPGQVNGYDTARH